MGTLLGVYDDGTKAADAIATLRDDGLDEISAYMPTPNHTIEKLLRTSTSPVRTFVLVGGVLGCVAGFALPVYTVYAWPLITGGKPLISIPAFVVIAFEMTILFAAITGMLGFLGLAGLPQTRAPLRDARFSNDHFGVAVRCTNAQVETVRAGLEAAGAIEIRTDA